MRNVIRIVLFCALAGCVTACMQDGDPRPDPADGIEELLDLAGPGGWIEADLDYQVTNVSASSHPGAEGDFEYLLAALEIDTASGHALRAVGIFWSADDGGVKHEELTVAGRIKIDGVGRVRDGLKAVTAGGSAIGSLGTPLRASLLLVTPDSFFDEADALFLGDAFMTPAATGHLESAGRLPLLADGEGGLFVGMVEDRGRDLSFGEMEIWFTYAAESFETPFGAVQLLRGYIAGQDETSLPAVSLAVGVVKPPRPEALVVYCADCDGDVMLAVPAEGFTATDDLWLKIKGLPTIPLWARGAAEVPLPMEYTCEEALEIAAAAIRGANAYRLHRLLLSEGAGLARVSSSVTVHPPGSRGHDSRLAAFLDHEGKAWEVVEFALERAEDIGCHK